MEWPTACNRILQRTHAERTAAVKRQRASHSAEVGSHERPKIGSEMLIKTVGQAKRWAKIVVGFTLLVLGVAMIFSPGPGFITILLGLGILAAEFVWARRLLNTLKEQGARLRQTVLKPVSGD